MQGSQQYAVNLYRTAVSPGVYPVTIATTSGNLDDTLFHFSIMRGTPAVCGCSKAHLRAIASTLTRATLQLE